MSSGHPPPATTTASPIVDPADDGGLPVLFGEVAELVHKWGAATVIGALADGADTCRAVLKSRHYARAGECMLDAAAFIIAAEGEADDGEMDLASGLGATAQYYSDEEDKADIAANTVKASGTMAVDGASVGAGDANAPSGTAAARRAAAAKLAN